MDELVPEAAIDYDEILRRGGANDGDEGFAFFKCPHCGRVYLLEYEVDTVYLDPGDLSRRVPVFAGPLYCEQCGQAVPVDKAWVGPEARREFAVNWQDLAASGWSWAAQPPNAGG